jgi:hypothetical protein
MYPFGVIGVAPRYIPAGAVIELAGIRLGCTSTPTGIRETQAGGNRIQGHLSRGGPESRADSGSLIPWWSRIAHLSVKSHPGIAPGPFLNQTNAGSGSLIPWWSRIASFSLKSHPGVAPGPSVAHAFRGTCADACVCVFVCLCVCVCVCKCARALSSHRWVDVPAFRGHCRGRRPQTPTEVRVVG